MEKINGLEEFSLMDFSKTAGEIKCKILDIYYNKKNSKIRMYDDNHVIKISGNNLEFLELLKSLSIEQVNSPIEILQDKNDNKYYLVSKYLNNYLELDFCARYFLPFDEILDYFIQVLEVLEKCHQKDFFVGDLHSSNVLISPDKKAYLFDFDQSIFLKDKIISIDKNETLYSLYENTIIKNVLQYTYGVKEEDLTFYNSNIELLKPFFIETDKEIVIREIIRLIFYKLKISKDEYSITKNDIKQLGLSRKFEKKLIDCFINNNPLYSDDYLIDELSELKCSKLVRKKLIDN